jgi:NAD(P)-dependent dehydrogenase (short-subunit alcohol dehydrogenase family)
MTTVFLTGASGFLGVHAATALRAQGHGVKVMPCSAPTDADIAALGKLLTCPKLQVDSFETERGLGYVQIPVDAVLADTLGWMRERRRVAA